ncbi:hypothetical protein ABFS82_08G027600 [Erythranthe guttata]|uniref:Glycosyltransferase n=1 Tax=Erythranthe guttata TaxID=4155 RepID=A0A022RWM7_ERYGU|nr:PREDICTED: UDP-glycosyltransferase 88A1-like [Erythranthe guttata]EYU44158.1 hypothetical protein MIMGU_mgv1a020049mg [Erythranthe guttata]|eukprot:XP_012855195.1 PREDICTED: UDP-glycosyltransferase 88A1-like [Erythranthe guttata]
MANDAPPHIALFPCAGMGHLLPFLRLSAMLSSRGCSVTLITVNPTVTAAESDHLSAFFAAHPQIQRLHFQLLPYKKSNFTNEDPFFIQMESISNSVHLLPPLLSTLSPPLSAVIADFSVANAVFTHLAPELPIPIYTLTTTSARFFTLMTNLPHLTTHTQGEDNNGYVYVTVPSLGRTPLSNIPPPMLEANHYFAANIISNLSSLSKLNGVIINTFDSFEPEAIEALISKEKLALVPKILPLGPFESLETDAREDNNLPWLDEQAPESVVFVSFGNRTALSKEQIRELGNGLLRSGSKFLWVLKGGKVDKDDKEEVGEILGESFLERVKSKGLVVKGWVNQELILGHVAVGGFVSHCGWNSVTEAARLGVPILAWPLHGDQGVNAEVVEKVGLGLWVRGWGLGGGEKLVGENEIAEKIKDLMGNQKLRSIAMEVKEKARLVREANGSSEMLIRGVIESLKNKGKA